VKGEGRSLGGEDAGPFGFGEDVLDHERVDVDVRAKPGRFAAKKS
jgi:hypothetical protein